MADEKAELLEKEEEEGTTAQEESEDSENESQETEETTETTETDVEEFENEEQWFESLGIGKMSGDKVAEEFKRLRQENDILKQFKAETGFQPKYTQQEQTQSERKFLKAKERAKTYISSLQFNEDDAGKRARESYSAMSRLVDSALDPIIDEAENGLQTVLQGIGAIAQHLQKQSYNSSRHKGLVRFEDIQPLMLKEFMLDADQAIRSFIVNNRPDLLAQLQQKAEEEGERRGQMKKLKRFSAARRQKQTSPTGVDWKPFFTHGEPNEKFHAQKTADRLKIAEAYQKAAQQDYEGR